MFSVVPSGMWGAECDGAAAVRTESHLVYTTNRVSAELQALTLFPF